MDKRIDRTETPGVLSKKLPAIKAWNSAYLIVIFAVFTVTYSCRSNDKPAERSRNSQPDTAAANAERNNLQGQVNAARVQVDELSSKTTVLDSQIRGKDAEIEKLQKEKKKLGSKNKSLAGKLKKDDKEIHSLRDMLSAKDKEYADRLGILQTDKDNLSRQLTDLMDKYKTLKALGSVLHASGMRIEPLHSKRNGRERVVRRARRLNILRVHFDIDENRIAEDGTKQLYLVITAPDGKLLSNAGNRSGAFTNYKGDKVSYSILKEIYLKQNEPVRNVTVDWDQEGEHQKGAYNITIYNGGYKIGAGSVDLR